MPASESEIDSLETLHSFVHQTLCETENLLAEQFETRQRPFVSKGQICAIEFILLGLRSIRLGAIWAADQNIVYFYNTRGERYREVQLIERFEMKKLAG